MSDSFSEGDIVLVDFEAWTDDGTLFDTTRMKVAEEAGWDTEDVPLDPMPVIIGAGRVVAGFEEALVEAELGEETEVEVPPEKGFGDHDANKVRVYPRKEFEKADIDPIPGNRIEIQNQRGTIVQATASRVRVDFNHPMAGKTLTYKFKVTDLVEDVAEQVLAIIKLDYGMTKAGEFEVEIEDDVATVTVPEASATDSRWFMAKHRLGHDLFDNTELDEVRFVETMTRAEMDSHHHGHAPPTAEDVEDAVDEESDDEDEA